MTTQEAARILKLSEIEELVQRIESELAKRHNWARQEEFWAHEAKMGRARNYIALAAIVATITAAAMAGMFGILSRFIP